MIRFRRRNTSWLIALGLLMAFALYVSPIALPLQILLIGLLLVAIASSLIEFSNGQKDIFRSIQLASIRRRISPQAKEAAERARNRIANPQTDLIMLDLGLIALQSSQDGISMRRTRTISKDDDGVRPFITLYVPTSEAERFALVRCEIYDQNGKAKYIYETKPYLREGKIDLIADHHLPLANNDAIVGAGDWDMRVYIDGDLFAIHTFNLVPSVIERRERLMNKPTANQSMWDDLNSEDKSSTTLEQLLKSEQQTSTGYNRIRTTSRPRKE